MSGTQHYREAERLATLIGEHPESSDAAVQVALAQVHATLALAAATAYPAVRDYWGDETDTSREWAGVAS